MTVKQETVARALRQGGLGVRRRGPTRRAIFRGGLPPKGAYPPRELFATLLVTIQR